MRFLAAILCGASLASSSIACSASSGSSSSQPQSDAGLPEASTPDARSDAEAGATGDAGPDAPPVPYPAFTPTAPAVTFAGGQVLAAPRVVPVFFGADANQAKVTDFVGKYLAWGPWKSIALEYGVKGDAKVDPPVVVDAFPASVTNNAQLQGWLASQLDGTHAAWGPVDDATLASTAFVLFVPSSVTLKDSSGYSLCGVIDGWHDHTTPPAGHDAGTGAPVAYAVVGECTDGSVPVLDAITGAASHEIAETLTDPLWDTAPAYYHVDKSHRYWETLVGGGEIGDMCAVLAVDSFTPPELGYSVQRLWSNAAAAIGQDPCQPTLPSDGPYFAAVPDAPDTFADPMYGGSVQGVSMPVGASRTIALRLFSQGPTADWRVQVSDEEGGNGIPFKLDRSTGHNGDVLHLTIGPAPSTPGKSYPFVVMSGDANASQASFWEGEVLVTP